MSIDPVPNASRMLPYTKRSTAMRRYQGPAQRPGKKHNPDPVTGSIVRVWVVAWDFRLPGSASVAELEYAAACQAAVLLGACGFESHHS